MFQSIRECASLLFMRVSLPLMCDHCVVDLIDDLGRAATRSCVRGDLRAVRFGTDALELVYRELAKRGLIDMSEAP